MGTKIIRLPDVGEGIAEAELVEWHVRPGQFIKEDQVLAAVMTDKATVEIPAPVSGTITALGTEVGTMLAVGAELVRIEVAGQPDDPVPPSPEASLATTGNAPNLSTAGSGKSAGDGMLAKAAEKPAAGPVQSAAAPRPTMLARRLPGEKPLASPAVRHRAREAGIDLRQVRGSGPAGRIEHQDLDGFLQGSEDSPSVTRIANPHVEEIKVIGLRRRIAQKMADSKRRAAHFSYIEEVDATAVEDLRATLNGTTGRDQPKLTILPFLMLAMAKAVAAFPQMNALYDDEAEVIQRFGGVHIGIATQTPSGLMVPVVRHVEARDLWGCAGEVKRLADGARDGQLERHELTGSTITITSLGALGGIATTPVLNLPEVAIVGVNRMVTRPVWRESGVVPRKMMNLSSSFDHRIVDGYDAAQFIQMIKSLLENPARIFMES